MLRSSSPVKFPRHWRRLQTHGAGRFVTQIVHRLPNGHFHIWSSRRFRKRRSSEVCASLTGAVPVGKKRRYWGIKPERLSWWIGVIFTLGSILFVLGAIPMMFPHPPVQTLSVLNFLGSLCFTVGSYAAFLEAINLNLDLTLERDVVIVETTVGAVPHPPQPWRKIKTFAWQPERIDYLSALIQLVGAGLFNINCFFALNQGLSWELDDALIWFPSALASLHFCLASYLAVVEVCHGYWAWRWRELEWWLVLLNLFGSIGFLSGSLFGFFGQGPVLCCQEWGTNFSFLWGSVLFLGGSYLMIPEMLQE